MPANLDLTALRSLYEQSTQGEWEATYRGAFEVHEGSVHLKGDELLDALVEQDNNETIRGELHYENARFCAAAHNSFPQLLAIAEAAQQLNAAAEGIMRGWKHEDNGAPSREILIDMGADNQDAWPCPITPTDKAVVAMWDALAAYRKALEQK